MKDTKKILAKMCQSELTKADINAICKNRGFSSKEASSPRLLENFLLSDTGVAEVMGTLSREEIILLHLMKLREKPADASIFAPIYGDKDRSRWWADTFTRQYSDVFKQAKISLIRRGLIFFAEERDYSRKKAKLEKLRFCFPTEFHKFLPHLFKKPRTLSGPGDINMSNIRKELLELISKSPRQKTYPLNITSGELRVGESIFSVKHFLYWQKTAWSASLAKKKEDSFDLPPSEYVNPVSTVIYALSQLGPDEWIPHGDLSQILKIFSFNYENKPLESSVICEEGWKWGYLARRKVGGRVCYRLADHDSESEREILPENYLKVNKNRTLQVSLETIPCGRLEYLAKICDFESKNARLTVSPNIVRIGRTFKEIQDDPLTQWLRENVPAFQKAFRQSATQWGKRIIHQDILMAKVNDLTLKVAIEKSFSDSGRIIFLPNNFIAFPRGILREMESVIKKSGYVIKTVEANE